MLWDCSLTISLTSCAGPPAYGGGHVYGGPHVGVGIGVVVPLNGPTHTHEGAVADEEDVFAGDQAYVSMTLISSHDGRVLWHARQSLDVELDHPPQIERMIDSLVGTIPPSLAVGRPTASTR